MPSIAQIPVSSFMTSSPPGGKKRKREQVAYGNGEDCTKLSSIQYTSSLPTSPFLSTSVPTEAITPSHASLSPRIAHKPRSLRPSRPLDAKRQRIPISEPAKHDGRSSLDCGIYSNPSLQGQTHTQGSVTGVRNPTTEAEAKAGYCKTHLSPCHICHQKPKVRTDLDSYADCEGCGKRTCHICMRACTGPTETSSWEGKGFQGDVERDRMSFTTQPLDDEGASSQDGKDALGFDLGSGQTGDRGQNGWPQDDRGIWRHRGKVCSQCCVERGADGEVRCLGCLVAEKAS